MSLLTHPEIKCSLPFLNNYFHAPKPAHMADSSNRYLKEENVKANSNLTDISLALETALFSS